MSKGKLVILSGAGISAESGLATFRGNGGLWEGHSIYDVATPEAWAKNPELVLDFYNHRRRQAINAEPNPAHYACVELEKQYDTVVITQNVDNLHERAGSGKVVHLHGELFKSRSTVNESLIFDIEGTELNLGDLCPLGSQLRPHIVWFGEMVPKMEDAIQEVQKADLMIVVGTSLQVYPAAGLVDYLRWDAPIYVVDPESPPLSPRPNLQFIPEKAGIGMERLLRVLLG